MDDEKIEEEASFEVRYRRHVFYQGYRKHSITKNDEILHTDKYLPREKRTMRKWEVLTVRYLRYAEMIKIVQWKKWITKSEERRNETYRVTLICFPPTGKTVDDVLTQPRRENMEIVAVSMPNRHLRIFEDTDMESWEFLTQSIVMAMENDGVLLARPFVFHGEGIGALIAFLVTKKLEMRNMPLPSSVFLRGWEDPIPDFPKTPLSLIPRGFRFDMDLSRAPFPIDYCIPHDLPCPTILHASEESHLLYERYESLEDILTFCDSLLMK